MKNSLQAATSQTVDLMQTVESLQVELNKKNSLNAQAEQTKEKSLYISYNSNTNTDEDKILEHARRLEDSLQIALASGVQLKQEKTQMEESLEKFRLTFAREKSIMAKTIEELSVENKALTDRIGHCVNSLGDNIIVYETNHESFAKAGASFLCEDCCVPLASVLDLSKEYRSCDFDDMHTERVCRLDSLFVDHTLRENTFSDSFARSKFMVKFDAIDSKLSITQCKGITFYGKTDKRNTEAYKAVQAVSIQINHIGNEGVLKEELYTHRNQALTDRNELKELYIKHFKSRPSLRRRNITNIIK